MMYNKIYNNIHVVVKKNNTYILTAGRQGDSVIIFNIFLIRSIIIIIIIHFTCRPHFIILHIFDKVPRCKYYFSEYEIKIKINKLKNISMREIISNIYLFCLHVIVQVSNKIDLKIVKMRFVFAKIAYL